ncbi:Mitochondrial distribution and morphology protein 10 [Malassezia cuniculi]|uniref:Mitochondrial distribution and morphology protein 10 n=1 Tax=Malassezia cuniculi TaxID=948313 RepID=A0AAF0J5B6_9BASI|nr:Mitochondrial distribution and morphology protein 10 [Malassezia cuniculi]
MDFHCTSSMERRLVRATEFLLPTKIVPRASIGREMLMYGNIHLPSTCMDAVFAMRLSPTHQLLVTALSTAPNYPIRNIGRWFGIKRKDSAALPSPAFGLPGTTGLQVLLKHISPHTFMEYSYSLDDALWGIRGLRTLSWPHSDQRTLSIGAELYFSAAAKSAGVSAGARYASKTGLFSRPDAAPLPAAATINVNPIMGHVRLAYAAMITKHLSLCTRYDINAYSYESDLAIGAEYLLHTMPENQHHGTAWMREAEGVWAPVPVDDRLSLREPQEALVQPEPSTHVSDSTLTRTHGRQSKAMLGVIKGRVSANGIVAFLWEGRWRQCIMSVGLKTRMQPSRKTLQPVLGLELMYIGDGGANANDSVRTNI